jgi:hypothetical protein
MQLTPLVQSTVDLPSIHDDLFNLSRYVRERSNIPQHGTTAMSRINCLNLDVTHRFVL